MANYAGVYMRGTSWGVLGDPTIYPTALDAANRNKEHSASAGESGFSDWLQAQDEKPLVSEAKKAGFDVSGAEITDAWAEIK